MPPQKNFLLALKCCLIVFFITNQTLSQNTDANPGLHNSSCMPDAAIHFSIQLSVAAVIGMDLD